MKNYLKYKHIKINPFVMVVYFTSIFWFSGIANGNVEQIKVYGSNLTQEELNSLRFEGFDTVEDLLKGN